MFVISVCYTAPASFCLQELSRFVFRQLIGQFQHLGYAMRDGHRFDPDCLAGKRG